MKRSRALLAGLAVAVLSASTAWSPADEKDKTKAKAAAKPPARSYSDEDLKKYKEPPREDSGGQAGSTGESSSADEPVPGQRRSREYGGAQVLPPVRPRSGEPQPEHIDPPPADEPSSAEEEMWKARAAEARRPLQEAQNHIQGIEAEITERREKLNPMSTKYVLGGNSIQGPDAIYEIEEQLRTLEPQLVDAQKAAVEAEVSWQRFLDEARAAGASPAWLNP